MRVLAIRGCNLASLAGEFEIDFQAEPLASAGLFAISGSTGAGKSTLLDALCLALYDETPRLRGAHARGVDLPDVEGTTTSPGDPRNLLRRGCAEGHAEVDFVGTDGVVYRARWSVRRARLRATGKLQASEMSLLSLADGAAQGGHRKGEVLQAIVERVGLSFEQFTRAVLLAQNEFSTFLKAGDDERAALLQTLTGTDRFERISRRAWERNKAEQEALAQLRARLGDQQPLADEARAECVAGLQANDAERLAGEGRARALERQLRWHAELGTAIERETAAAKALEAVLGCQADAAPQRSRLELLDAVQPARALQARLVHQLGEEARVRANLVQANSALAVAKGRCGEVQADLARAEARRAELDAARGVLAPRLAEARSLDTRIAAQRSSHAAAERRHQQAALALGAAQQALGANREAGAAAQAAQVEVEAWLERHGGVARLAEQWPRWQALLAQAVAEQAAGQAAGIELARLQQQADAEIAVIGRLAQDEAALQGELQSAQQAEAALATALAGFDPAGLAGRRQQLEQDRQTLALGQGHWQARTQLAATLEQADADTRRSESRRAAASQRLEVLRTELPAACARAEEATEAWRVVFEASQESIERLRAGLSPGSPCSVCGATEHPYAEHHPGLDGALDRLAEARKQREQERDALRVDELAQGRELQHAAGEIERLTSRRSALKNELASAEAAWSASSQALLATFPSDPPVGPAEALAGWFEQRGAALRALGREVEAIDSRLRDTSKRHQTALRARETCQQKIAALRELIGRRHADEIRLRGEIQAASQRQTSSAQRLAERLDELDAAHTDPAWRAAWQAAPAEHATRCAEAVVAWLARKQQCDGLRQRRTELEGQAEGLAKLLAQAAQHEREAATTLAGLQGELEHLQRERMAILAGASLPEWPADDGGARQARLEELSVERIEDVLAGAIKAASEHDAAVRRAIAEASEALAGRRAEREQWERQSTALELDCTAARAALEDWLGGFRQRPEEARLDAEALAALLAVDAAAIAALRGQLQALDGEVASARGAQQELARQRAAHLAARPQPVAGLEDTPSVLAVELEALSQQLDSLRRRQVELQASLQRDDDLRAKCAELRSALATQEQAARIWQVMSELIGSQDGKKFRNYAQQLTLDVLLGYANAHLADLARRYRLQRVPATLALMVIDQDMADEARSVHSLSGGESFLVSLALALGLASLSSHRLRVESLFIDEGFGSLDAETLRVAMDALDSLQALGRKVGVISHVQEMTERIGTRIEVVRVSAAHSRLRVGV